MDEAKSYSGHIDHPGVTTEAFRSATAEANKKRKLDTPGSIKARMVALAIYVRDRKRMKESLPKTVFEAKRAIQPKRR